MNRPSTGDVLFTRGRSILNRITVRITGPASHQATVYDSHTIVEASAKSGRIQKASLNDSLDRLAAADSEWVIFHWVNAIPASRNASIRRDLDEAIRYERYSYIELPLQLLDVVLNRWLLRRPPAGLDAKLFRRLGDIWDRGVICSKTSNRPLIRAGLIPQSSGLEYGSPSDTYRWLLSGTAAAPVAWSTGWFSIPSAGTHPMEGRRPAVRT